MPLVHIIYTEYFGINLHIYIKKFKIIHRFLKNLLLGIKFI